MNTEPTPADPTPADLDAELAALESDLGPRLRSLFTALDLEAPAVARRRSAWRPVVLVAAGAVGVVGAGIAVASRDTVERVPAAQPTGSAVQPEQTPAGGAIETADVTVTGDPLPMRTQAAVDPAVGTAAPRLTGVGPDGSAVTVGGPSDSPTLVAVVAHWCPHCQAEMPRLVTWAGRSATDDGLRIVAVSTGVGEELPNFPPSAWFTRESWPFDVLVDSPAGDASSALGLDGYPYLVLLDAEGTLLARWSGEMSIAEMETWVAAGLGVPPDTSVTG